MKMMQVQVPARFISVFPNLGSIFNNPHTRWQEDPKRADWVCSSTVEWCHEEARVRV
jgi:hypothetical protein